MTTITAKVIHPDPAISARLTKSVETLLRNTNDFSILSQRPQNFESCSPELQHRGLDISEIGSFLFKLSESGCENIATATQKMRDAILSVAGRLNGTKLVLITERGKLEISTSELDPETLKEFLEQGLDKL